MHWASFAKYYQENKARETYRNLSKEEQAKTQYCPYREKNFLRRWKKNMTEKIYLILILVTSHQRSFFSLIQNYVENLCFE